MRKIIMIFILCLMGCASQQVRDEDLNSWKDRSLLELEKHPLFSALEREKRELPNGQYIINFTDKRLITSSPASCFHSGVGTYGGGSMFGIGAETCSNKEIIEKNCVHQFLIEGRTVISYKVLGEDCYTTCKNQPNPEKCSQK